MRVRSVSGVLRVVSRFTRVLTIAMLTAPWCSAAAQMRSEVRAPAAPATLLARGHTLTVVAGGERHRIVLPDSLRVDMDTAEVLDSQHLLSTSYLLLTVRGPSKRNGFGAGQCGAGFETAIVWLELREWRVRRVQSQLVESCWENRMITGTITRKGNSMRMTFVDVEAHPSDHVVEYDGDRPERGLTVSPETRHE